MGSIWRRLAKQDGHTSSFAAVRKAFFAYWTIGFVDLRGNNQYISVGNLHHDDRIALFLMDYPGQQRLKILGRVEIREGDEASRKLIRELLPLEEKSPPERVLLIHVEAFDWNCPQHITPRYTEEEWAELSEATARD